ncbi:DUF3280 domain-containing protein [Methylobacterium sp. NEAU 140]|uniref:DUF3280 domain-containing protein n=1 Tax=Methylobacterium sp. NEAU 140 TaxID=3064945 RepID=UPI00273525D7|nr:DUF3280 domain-containing protein [Methylobacterium sp. NEAU 140]MDP4022227.1 DUF3280 domain-containing protein [Methylobacterium sp. NEAU 140]
MARIAAALFATVLATVPWIAGPALAASKKAAVFDLQYSNLSPVPTDAAEHERLKRTSAELRDLLRDKGLFTVVSTDPVRDEVAKGPELRRCNGCADALARKLGADVAITGEVQKVSNLILNLNVYVKPLDGTGPERAYSVDLRGNTDESFDRAVRFLVENNMGAGR